MGPLSITDVAETVGLIRDMVFLLLAAVALMVVLALYRKVTGVLGSANRIMQDAEDIVSTVSRRVVRPAAAGAGVAFGAGKALSFLFGLARRRRRGGTKNGEQQQ